VEPALPAGLQVAESQHTPTEHCTEGDAEIFEDIGQNLGELRAKSDARSSYSFLFCAAQP